jgi:hypothetical protein
MRESFIEENCIFFLNEEENSHHQHDLFKSYNEIMENRLEEFLKEFSLAPEVLGEALLFASTSENFKEMAMLIEREDDFQYFKQ